MVKKRLFLFLTALLPAIFGCSDEETPTAPQKDTVYLASSDTLRIVNKDTVYFHQIDTISSKDTVWMADSTAAGLGKLAYVGSGSCDSCHPGIAQKYAESGHRFALHAIKNDSAPRYPKFVPPTQPPIGKSWRDISYVVGGYKWKAVFLDKNGYVHTSGGKNQFNVADTSYSDFLKDSAEVKFSCAKCHATGYHPDTVFQDSMAGLGGTWSEPGVQCEACHGPGSHHVESRGLVPIRIDRSARACGKCHSNGDISTIPVHNGFILPNAQYNELMQSKKAFMACVDCHDPHASTVYFHAKGEGIRNDCRNCHQTETEGLNAWTGHSTNLVCSECHMPKIGKSAKNKAHLWGDLSSHLFRIRTDSSADQFNFAKNKSMPYVNLEYGCLKCHGDSGIRHSTFAMHEGRNLTSKSKSWAATFARGLHRKAVGGKDFYVGAAACMTCHGPVKWDSSAHAKNFRQKIVGGQNVIHGFGGNCQPCHVTGYGSHSGWANFTSLKKPSIEDSLRLEGVQCEACHGPGSGHAISGDKKDVAGDVDYKKTCLHCHAGTFDLIPNRDMGPADITEVVQNSGGLRHPQGFLYYGVKGYEYLGSNYGHSQHLSRIGNGCVTCHMATGTGHELKADKEACVVCHKDFTSTKTVAFGDTLFFDYRGVQDTVAGLLHRLDSLVNNRALAVATTSADTVKVKNTFSWQAASYNLNTIKADKSGGLHDYPYIKKLLEDAIADSSRYLNLLP